MGSDGYSAVKLVEITGSLLANHGVFHVRNLNSLKPFYPPTFSLLEERTKQYLQGLYTDYAKPVKVSAKNKRQAMGSSQPEGPLQTKPSISST